MNQLSRIVAERPAGSFSAAEFGRMCALGAFAGMRIELVEGELHRMTPPMGSHSHRQTVVLAALLPVVGLRAMVEATIELGEDTIVTCDVAVLHVSMAEHRFLRPEEVALVVEVAETSLARDLGVKRARYAAAGIAEYWVVDAQRSVVHVCREPVAGDYAMLATTRFGMALAVPGTGAAIVIG